MADLIDLDLTAPADSLYSGGVVLNTWRARIDDHNARHESGGDDEITGVVLKALFNANTILYATTDDTPVALTVAEQRLIGRLTGGNISAITIGIADNNILQVDGSPNANEYARITANGLEGRTESEFKADFNLEIGTDVQAYDAELAALAGLTSAADKLPYFTGSGMAAVTTLSSYMRGIIDDANEATFKASVNLEIGTDVLAQQTIGIANDNLLEVDHVSPADDDYAKFTTAGLEGRSYSEVKTDLSLNLVENTAISSWAGSGNITTIGTVTSGTLSTGAVLADVTMTLGSDVDADIYYRASNKLTRLAKGTATQVLTMNSGATAPEWAVASGGVDTSGTPADDDYAKFTDADTIEGRSYSEVKNDLAIDVVHESDGTLKDNVVEVSAKTRAWLNATQLDLTSGTPIRVDLDTETYDIGSDFDVGLLGSGTADGTTGGHLIDSGYDFAAAGIAIGMRIKNTTDTTFTYITAVAVGDLTVRDDIFVDTEGWEVRNARFTAPVNGYYEAIGSILYLQTVTNKYYAVDFYKNGSIICQARSHASTILSIGGPCADIVYLAASDYLELYAHQSSGVDTVDLYSWEPCTYLSVHFLSKG